MQAHGVHLIYLKRVLESGSSVGAVEPFNPGGDKQNHYLNKIIIITLF